MSRSSFRLTAAAALIAVVAPFAVSSAQVSRVRMADSLLAAGNIGAAESLYFRAAAANPRDVVARAALGRYLASRGAWRIGAVLLEEARFFGADAQQVARSLAPVYRQLGDWKSIAALPSPAVTMGERAQAAWLSTHDTDVEMPDSVAVPLIATTDGQSLGSITVRIGGRPVVATIDPSRSGLVLDASLRADQLRTFRLDSTGVVPAIVGAMTIGQARLRNVPARIEDLGGAGAVMGLDFLARFAPAFDATRHRLVLHASNRVPSGGERRAIVVANGAAVAANGALVPLGSSPLAARMRSERWSYDARRGEIVFPDGVTPRG